MIQLFEVTTNNYKRYYVLANGFDEARNKAEYKMIEDNTTSILSSDGSLNKEYKTEIIDNIKCLGTGLIT